METCEPANTLMVEKSKLDEDPQGKVVDPTCYRRMIGTLMYLTSSRPYLVFIVCMCARYQAKPTEKHLHAVKRIFQYLRGTINMVLWYLKDSCIAQTDFADADHAGCQETRKSTSGSIQLLGDRLIGKYLHFSVCSGTETEEGLLKVYKAGKRLLYVKRNKAISLGNVTSKVGIEGFSGREQTPEKVTGVDLFYLHSMDQKTTNVPHRLAQYLFRHAEGRKSRARLSRGHFIGYLAMHFGLVSDEGLRGLQVVTRELPLIDLHELGRFNICSRFGDTWAWEILAQAHLPPSPVPQPQTRSQRIERIEEEMRDLRRDVLMDASSHTYQSFDSTLIGSSRMPYQRRVRPRICDASTSATPHTDA
ncbi:hypothetical protein Tco_1217274 [Tanacetum coccineum]